MYNRINLFSKQGNFQVACLNESNPDPMTMFHEVLYLHSSYFLMYRFESNKTLSKNKKEDLKETGHLLNQSWLQN